nr:polymerase p2 [Prunus necrotic ringspot virus]
MNPLNQLLSHGCSAISSALHRDVAYTQISDECFDSHFTQISTEYLLTTSARKLFEAYMVTMFLKKHMSYVFEDFIGSEMGPYVQTRWRIVFDLDEVEEEYVYKPDFYHYDVYDYEMGVDIPASIMDDIPFCEDAEAVTSRNCGSFDEIETVYQAATSFDESCTNVCDVDAPHDTIKWSDEPDLMVDDPSKLHDLDDEVPQLQLETVGRVVQSVEPLVPDINSFETNQLHLVKEVVLDRFESILECHEKVLARNDWKSLAMYVPTDEIPSVSDILEIPVKHTQPEFIQMAIDEMLPGVSDLDDRFFQEIIETSDINLEIDRASIDMSVFNDWTPKSGRLNGLFQTGNISKRVPTFREASLAIKKRNLNVPDLQQVLHEDDEARFIANKFINTVIDPNKLAQFPGYISEGEMGYFNKYLSGKAVPDDAFVDPCALVSMDKYRHMIKTQLKPVEDTSQLFERPLAATITYHDKGKVMSTSPIFLMMCNRLLLCLNDKISIPSGKHHQLFSLDPFAFEMTKEFKEIDFSKFDKSQQRLHHLIQFHIFTALGAPKDFLDMWFGSHEISHIRDGPCGIGFSVNYQRRTGDACTYLGNTIITLSALAYMYDLLDPNVTFVIASGDDSLIGSIKPLDRSEEFKFVTLFNFEAKFPHNQPFVCSKFLCLLPTVSGGKKVLAVPNALKLNIKLGVKDLAPCVFDAWYKSWLDLIWYFDNYLVVSTMKDYISHRYLRRQTCYQEGAMLAYGTIFSSKEKCLKSLFGITSKDLEAMLPMSKNGKGSNRAECSKNNKTSRPPKSTRCRNSAN